MEPGIFLISFIFLSMYRWATAAPHVGKLFRHEKLTFYAGCNLSLNGLKP
jgi:hypothetical protein